MLTMFDLFSREDYEAAVDARLINVRTDRRGLLIHNYSDAALFTAGAWDNPAVRQCRGLITTDQGLIVARPWAKFFNHGQAETGDLDLSAPVEVTDKMDGSLGIIYPGGVSPRVATRGSFESDQALHATTVLLERYAGALSPMALAQITPLVEIVYPDNRIVCDYGDTDDLILLGGVHIGTGTYLSPGHVAHTIGWTGPVVKTFEYRTLADALAAAPRPGAEGLCVRYAREPKIVKVKQDDYVRLHRIVTGLSERSVWEHMSADGELEDLLADLPDELHDWTRDTWDGLFMEAARIDQFARDEHAVILANLPDGWTRKEYAMQAQERTDLRPYLFQLLDGREPWPSILRNLKPAGDTRAKAISEAVA